MPNRLKQGLVTIDAYAKFGQIPSICSQDIERKVSISIKDHTSVINLRNLTRNNPNLDLVNINAYAEFGQIPSIYSQHIERKRNSDSVINLYNLTPNNPSLDLVNINA